MVKKANFIFFPISQGGYGKYPGGGYYLPNATNPQVIGSLRGNIDIHRWLYWGLTPL